jgi:hypothetical protein
MAWLGAWISGSLVVLVLLDRVEKRARVESAARGRPGSGA